MCTVVTMVTNSWKHTVCWNECFVLLVKFMQIILHAEWCKLFTIAHLSGAAVFISIVTFTHKTAGRVFTDLVCLLTAVLLDDALINILNTPM